MALDYAWERFFAAVLSLIHEGRLTDRLDSAFGNLTILNEDDFREDDKLRERFSDLMRRLARFERQRPRSIEEIEAESRGLHLEEAESVAEEVLSIFDDIARRDPSHWYHVASDIDLAQLPH